MENFELNTPDDETRRILKKHLRNDILIGFGIIAAVLALVGRRKEPWVGYFFLIVVGLVIVGIIYRNMRRKNSIDSFSDGIQGLRGNNMDSITEEQRAKWYNDKLKLGLSILIWPVMVYGIYKSSLLKKNAKILIAIVVVTLCLLAPKKPNVGGGDEEGIRLTHQSPWDGSVPIVEEYIKKSLNDPGSYESVKWGEVGKNSDGTYHVLHTFRAKNGFGGTITQLFQFTIDSDGKYVIAQQQLQ